MTRTLVVWMHAPGYPQWTVPAASLAAIRDELGPGWRVLEVLAPLHASGDGATSAPPELLSAIAGAEVCIGFGLPAEALRAARALRWVHTGAAGVGALLHPEVRKGRVRVTNSAGIHAAPLAEFVLAALLHFGRGLDIAGRAKRERSWAHAQISAAQDALFELEGRTLGVVGYGGIGAAVGRRAAALGMRVLGLRRRPGPAAPAEVEAMLGPEDLPRLLGASHAVVLCLPETPGTRGLIGPAELAAMRRDSVLINVSRGGIVDEKALAEALAEGRLRGAALDVVAREPLPPDSPLWTLDNVLLVPHTAALTSRFWERETELILRNLRRYLAGEPLENEVDPQRGY